MKTLRVVRRSTFLIALFAASATFSVGCAGADDESASSASQAVEKDAYGQCIKAGVSTHGSTWSHAPGFHAYVRNEHPNGQLASIRLEHYKNDRLSRTSTHRGTGDIDFWVEDSGDHDCARVVAVDPCSRKSISSAWACM